MSLGLGVRFTYFGHSTFLLTSPEGTELLIDPWVMNNPACPVEFHQPERVDAILITHGHFDHIQDAVEIVKQCKPKMVVANFEIGHWLQSKGVPEDAVISMNKGGTVEVMGIRVTMTHADHSSGILDDGQILYGGEPCGYAITFENGRRIYNAGDTAVFSDMALIAELYEPELAMLPIGDHFTMDPREAAKACEILGVSTVIPQHYGTFPLLRGTPEALRQECTSRGIEVEVVEVKPGDSVD